MFTTLAAVLSEGSGHGGEVSTFTYWLAAGIFFVCLGLIVSEVLHKTHVAVFGGSLMLALSIVHQNESFYSHHTGVDWNVIFLLIGMMILVHVMSTTGVFEWVAVKLAKAADGRPFRIMVLLVVFTAVASAFLDNVTTVLLLTPVTLLIASELDIDAKPFLIAEVLASNIGGTATLIGDPPNIIIGSRAQLDFAEFLIHLAPVVIVIMVVFVGMCWLVFGRSLEVDEGRRQKLMNMDVSEMISDKKLAWQSLIVLTLTLVAFILHGWLHLEPATIAFFAAATLMIVTRVDPEETLSHIEWPTIFFFIGLFMMVGGIVKVGVIGDISKFLIEYTEPTSETMFTTSMVILWASGVLSALVDNIPYVATMSPLITDTANQVFHGGALEASELTTETLHNPVLKPVWWSLALGSCLGGNGSPIGASANVIVIGIAARSNVRISFLEFMAYGVPVTIVSLAISHAYVWLRYY